MGDIYDKETIAHLEEKLDEIERRNLIVSKVLESMKNKQTKEKSFREMVLETKKTKPIPDLKRSILKDFRIAEGKPEFNKMELWIKKRWILFKMRFAIDESFLALGEQLQELLFPHCAQEVNFTEKNRTPPPPAPPPRNIKKTREEIPEEVNITKKNKNRKNDGSINIIGCVDNLSDIELKNCSNGDAYLCHTKLYVFMDKKLAEMGYYHNK